MRQPEEQPETPALMTGTPAELNPSLRAELRLLTPARIALRRTGVSLATSEVLDFQLAHARARDAVHAALQPASLLTELRNLGGPDPILLHSAAPDRPKYLKRPDLGRKLDESSRKRLASLANDACDVAFVVADGLSALAVERHAVPVLAELLPALAALRLAPICLVEQGRVAIGDQIAAALGAELAVVLIGERPGLSSPDSLGAYLTWHPRPGSTTDAERNCVSNIRAEGLSYKQAAARILHYLLAARSHQTTGVTLKDPDPATERLALLSAATETSKKGRKP